MIKRYTIIRSVEQYRTYCKDLEKLTAKYDSKPSDKLLDLIDTIDLLIIQYDEQHIQMMDVDPIQLLRSLMRENNLKQKDIANLLGISKGHLSDILNYKKGLSKNVIRILSERFKVRQNAFNRPFKLTVESKKYRNTG
jgi:HTH-type transcriptional regulator/antitoxin HigA